MFDRYSVGEKMNEQIRELTREAGFELNPAQFDHEKFAEMIIRECAKFAKRYTSDETNTEHYEEVGWECLPLDLQYAMLEYFGVK